MINDENIESIPNTISRSSTEVHVDLEKNPINPARSSSRVSLPDTPSSIGTARPGWEKKPPIARSSPSEFYTKPKVQLASIPNNIRK
jgi:hypothetical protein